MKVNTWNCKTLQMVTLKNSIIDTRSSWLGKVSVLRFVYNGLTNGFRVMRA